MDPYQVLGVAVDDSLPTIKAAYTKLALKYHPDKNSQQSEQFLVVQQAWEKIHELRAAEKVVGNSTKHTFSETIPFHQFLFDASTELYSSPCRCGDVYEFSMNEVRDGFNTFQCNGCSLHVTVDTVPSFNDTA